VRRAEGEDPGRPRRAGRRVDPRSAVGVARDVSARSRGREPQPRWRRERRHRDPFARQSAPRAWREKN